MVKSSLLMLVMTVLAVVVAAAAPGQQPSLSRAVAPPASAPNMKILTMYGENLTTQRGIVNVRLVGNAWVAHTPPGSVFNFSNIDEGFMQHKMSAFIDLEAYNGFVYDSCHVLKNGTRDCTGLRQPNALDPRWKSVMAKTIQASRSRLISGAIAGFFLGDEMICNGLPISNFTNLVNFIKHTLTASKLVSVITPANLPAHPQLDYYYRQVLYNMMARCTS
jgi:hypothetical protein